MLDVGYIEYKNEKYPVRVSYKALKGYKKKVGKNFDGDTNFDDLEVLLYFALKVGAEYEGIDFNFKENEMEDVLDECFIPFQRLIPKFFITNDDLGVEGDVKKKKK